MIRTRLLRKIGHTCRPPRKVLGQPYWTCWCGQQWTSVFVPLRGFRWFRAELEVDA